MNQRQLQIIEYVREKIRVLREQLGEGRLQLSDDQRRRLATRAKGLGRKVLSELVTIVTPETLFRNDIPAGSKVLNIVCGHRTIAEFIQHYPGGKKSPRQRKCPVLRISNDPRSKEGAGALPRATGRPAQVLPFTRNMGIFAIRPSNW